MPEPGGRASSSPLLGGGPEPTLAEISSAGRKAWSFPDLDVPAEPLHIDERREEAVRLSEAAEHDIVMHFTRLAHRNFAVDLGAYPLGSCTMKYNPKVADSTVELFAGLHPDAPTSTIQGALEVLVEAERMLCELTGMYRAIPSGEATKSRPGSAKWVRKQAQAVSMGSRRQKITFTSGFSSAARPI